MSTEFVTLDWVQSSLKQSSENGWFDVTPVGELHAKGLGRGTAWAEVGPPKRLDRRERRDHGGLGALALGLRRRGLFQLELVERFALGDGEGRLGGGAVAIERPPLAFARLGLEVPLGLSFHARTVEGARAIVVRVRGFLACRCGPERGRSR